MRIIDNWQYRYIEKCLYSYDQIKQSCLQTEKKMTKAIEMALEFFEETSHAIMLKEFYFRADHYRRTLSNSGHYKWVCEKLLHTEEPNGYVIRREIVYRVAMNCYALNLFQLNPEES